MTPTIGVQQPRLTSPDGDAAGDHLSALGLAFPPVLGMHEVVEAECQGLALPSAEQPTELSVDLEQRAVMPVRGHSDRRVLEGTAEALSRPSAWTTRPHR
jgi:hypothetical protein